jgi:hypothetical protein
MYCFNITLLAIENWKTNTQYSLAVAYMLQMTRTLALNIMSQLYHMARNRDNYRICVSNNHYTSSESRK